MTDQDHNQPDQAQLKQAFKYYPRLRKVKEYVEKHLDEPITLKDAADVVSLEAKYFSAWFKEKTGWKFSEWLQYTRVEKAKQLLEQQVLSISNLALKVGYSTPRGFQRAFMKWTGMTPKAYKQQCSK